MTDDPNDDLIGYEFDAPVGRARVLESWKLNAAYVLIEWLKPDGKGTGVTELRPTSVVRRHKELAP